MPRSLPRDRCVLSGVRGVDNASRMATPIIRFRGEEEQFIESDSLWKRRAANAQTTSLDGQEPCIMAGSPWSLGGVISQMRNVSIDWGIWLVPGGQREIFGSASCWSHFLLFADNALLFVGGIAGEPVFC